MCNATSVRLLVTMIPLLGTHAAIPCLIPLGRILHFYFLAGKVDYV